jgi:hypothetical protein
MSVVILLVQLLGVLQIVAKDLMELTELLDESLGGGVNRLRRRSNGNKIAGMVSLVGEKGGELCRCVLGIIINEFSIGK